MFPNYTVGTLPKLKLTFAKVKVRKGSSKFVEM